MTDNDSDSIVEPIHYFLDEPGFVSGLCALIVCFVLVSSMVFITIAILVRFTLVPIVFVVLAAYLTYSYFPLPM